MRRSALVIVPAIISLAVAMPAQAATYVMSCTVNGYFTYIQYNSTTKLYHVHGLDVENGNTPVDTYVSDRNAATWVYMSVCRGV